MTTNILTKTSSKKNLHLAEKNALLEKVTSAIERFQLFSKGSRVLVGVSGGPDSMVLLHVLLSLKARWNLRIVAAHLNHRTRGEESERDQKFVERWAGRWNVPCVIERSDTPLGKSSASWEDFWREIRWEFFLKFAREFGSDTVVLAHHLNDQAETVLARLLRGTGPGGLAAMRHVSVRDGLRIVRPLLDVSRDEITGYAKANGIRFVEDSSNRLPQFLRNRIRHDLIPYLEANYQGKIQVLLAHLAAISAEEDDLLEEIAIKNWRKVFKEKARTRIVFDAKALACEHPAIRYRILRIAAEKLGGLRQIDFWHAEKIRSLLESGARGSVDLSRGIEIRREREFLVISKKPELNGNNDARSYCYPVEIGKPCVINECGLSIQVRRCRGSDQKTLAFNHKNRGWHEIIDEESVKFPLSLRNRKLGDRFHPYGQSKPMKLKDFFIREHLPSFKRKYWPLLISSDEIIWVPGYRISNSVRVGSKTNRFLELKAESVST